jgi:hypothetical protein
MNVFRILFLVFLILPLHVGHAYAAINWSVWMWQPDGSYWRTGVDDSGNQHCQTKPSENGPVSDVSCKK